MILQAISNYLTEHNIKHTPQSTWIEIRLKLDRALWDNPTYIIHLNPKLSPKHTAIIVRYTRPCGTTIIHLADPELLPKILQIIQQ